MRIPTPRTVAVIDSDISSLLRAQGFATRAGYTATLYRTTESFLVSLRFAVPECVLMDVAQMKQECRRVVDELNRQELDVTILGVSDAEIDLARALLEARAHHAPANQELAMAA